MRRYVYECGDVEGDDATGREAAEEVAPIRVSVMTRGLSACLLSLAVGVGWLSEGSLRRPKPKAEAHARPADPSDGFTVGSMFSPDGKTLVTVGSDGATRFWDVASGTMTRTCSWGGVQSLAYSPDGKTLAIDCPGGMAKLYDAASGEERGVLESTRGIRGLAFAPDSRVLALGHDDGTITLHDLAEDRVRTTLPATLTGNLPPSPPSPINQLAFSPDGKTLAASRIDGYVSTWDVEACRPRMTFKANGRFLRSLAYAPDGRTLAAIVDLEPVARLWDATDGSVRATLRGHEKGIGALAFAPDGRTLATAGADGTVRLWDAATGREKDALQINDGWLFTVAISPDGAQLACGGEGGDVTLWEMARGGKPRVRTFVPPAPKTSWAPPVIDENGPDPR